MNTQRPKKPNTMIPRIALALKNVPGWQVVAPDVDVELARVAYESMREQLPAVYYGAEVDVDDIVEALRAVPGWIETSPQTADRMARAACGEWAARFQEVQAEAFGREPPPRKPGTRLQ